MVQLCGLLARPIASWRWWYEMKMGKRRLLSLCKASAFSLFDNFRAVILMHFCIRFISVENNVLFMYVTGLFLLGAACVNKKEKNGKDPIIFLSSSSILLLFGSNLPQLLSMPTNRAHLSIDLRRRPRFSLLISSVFSRSWAANFIWIIRSGSTSFWLHGFSASGMWFCHSD